MTDARSALRSLIENSPDSYASISALIGRNPAYIQQFIERGSPRELKERDRHKIARHFAVDEAVLRGAGSPPSERMVSIEAGVHSRAPTICFPLSWLIEQNWQVARLRTFRVESHSLEPQFRINDIVIYEECENLSQKGLYLVREHGDEPTFRCIASPLPDDRRDQATGQTVSICGIIRWRGQYI